jgi:hypothetical protein
MIASTMGTPDVATLPPRRAVQLVTFCLGNNNLLLYLECRGPRAVRRKAT